jgi:hypothetical protein
MHASVYLLFHRNGITRVADATALFRQHFPDTVIVARRNYRLVRGEDTFFFWDELIDSDSRTVGFSFLLPVSPTLRQSRLIADSKNTAVEGDEVRINLSPGGSHVWDCVQGFGSEVYQADDDPADCAIMMMNWSGRLAGVDLANDLAITTA